MPGTHAITFVGNGPVFQVALNASASGNNTVVAAQAGKKIVLLCADAVLAAANTLTWQSSGGTVLDGPKSFAINGGQIFPMTELGHFATLAGEGLVLNLTGANQVGGHVVYAVVG